MDDCLFCKIANGEIKAQIVWEDELVLAFRDIDPQAPAHLLIIPRQHIGTLQEAGKKEALLLGHLLLTAREVAAQQKIQSGYRVVINNGAGAGQSVFHLHLHLLGGRRLSWPPG